MQTLPCCLYLIVQPLTFGTRSEEGSSSIDIFGRHSPISLSPGDTIRRVNGHSVNLDNIDSVLAGLSNEVCA